MSLLTPQISTRYTPQDLLSMPDNSGMELVDGQIVEKQVSRDSSKIEGLFLLRIGAFIDSHPIAEIYSSSLGYTCFPAPGKMRKPDVSIVLLSRLNQLPKGDYGYMTIVPDLAIEVISPNDVTYEIDDKVQEYLDAAFPLVWVADPRARTITVHPLSGRPAIFTSEDEITAESALPGFRCKVGDFFPVSAFA